MCYNNLRELRGVMLRNIVIIIVAMLVTTSCATVAANNLQNATRISADASFAFDAATRDFIEAINNYRNAVINFEFSVQRLVVAETSSDVIRARDDSFHAERIARNTRELVIQTHIIASNAYDDSIRAGLNFARAQQELLVSSDPWQNNTSIRSTAIRANNISVGVHNTALAQFQSAIRRYTDLMVTHTENIRVRGDVLRTHNLTSMPDELLPYFFVFVELFGDDASALHEAFNVFVDAFYSDNN